MTLVIDERIKKSLACVQQLKGNVDRTGQQLKPLRMRLIQSLRTIGPTNVSILIIFSEL